MRQNANLVVKREAVYWREQNSGTEQNPVCHVSHFGFEVAFVSAWAGKFPVASLDEVRQLGIWEGLSQVASAASPRNLWRCMAPLRSHSLTLQTRANSRANGILRYP